MRLSLAWLVNSPSRGTYANVATRFAVGLTETGRVDTTLVCYGDDPPPPWLPKEIRIHRLRTRRVSRSLLALTEYLHLDQPQVLISRQVHANLVALAAAGAARLRRGWAGNLVLSHDHPAALAHASNRRDNKWLAKLGYRFADGVIACSPAIRQDAIDWCGVSASSVALVPIPITPFTTLTEPPHPWLDDGPPVFVTTANLVRWKRMELLLDAFADVRIRHDVRLIIIGEGPERASLRKQIERLGLTASAETLGWVADPRQYAARACAFVLASDEEGFAQVLTEAMSTGCPVIAADALGGGPRYVTANGRFGLLVPRSDARQLTQAMESMLVPETRARYARLALERAEVFSPIRCATALVDFLETRVERPLR